MQMLLDNKLSFLIHRIKPLVEAVNRHKVFDAVTSLARLRKFAQIHVYAVWDFMCLHYITNKEEWLSLPNGSKILTMIHSKSY